MKKLSILVVVLVIMSAMIIAPSVSANDSDYFVYSHLDTGVGSYGVDGYVGADGVDRIIFYSGSTAYIYTVTIPEGSEPNMHPNNPEAPGPVAPRTFTLENTFSLGVSPGHESEFYVDEENNIIYLGASHGIRKYVYDAGNYVYDSDVAPPAPMEEGYHTQSLAYDPDNDMWYAGSIAWNDLPGVTLRDMWKYDGSQGSGGTWQLAFNYTTPEGTDPSTHHDGLEFINGYLWLADYVGDYVQQYTTDGERVEIFYSQPLEHELEGMGFGALGHFWCGSHGSNITEFGGGALQQALKIEVYVDIKPMSWPNPLNVKSKGVLPVAILGTEDFDVSQIDPATVRLEGVAPLRWALEDVGTASDPLAGPDGIMDLSLKFDRQEIVSELGAVNDGDNVALNLTGNLKVEFGGTPISGQDVVLIIKKK